jgi:hypothetical protein
MKRKNLFLEAAVLAALGRGFLFVYAAGKSMDIKRCGNCAVPTFSLE